MLGRLRLTSCCFLCTRTIDHLCFLQLKQLWSKEKPNSLILLVTSPSPNKEVPVWPRGFSVQTECSGHFIFRETQFTQMPSTGQNDFSIVHDLEISGHVFKSKRVKPNLFDDHVAPQEQQCVWRTGAQCVWARRPGFSHSREARNTLNVPTVHISDGGIPSIPPFPFPSPILFLHQWTSSWRACRSSGQLLGSAFRVCDLAI